MGIRDVPVLGAVKRTEVRASSRFGEDNLIQAQRFADGPRLERTTARRVRRFGVGNFRNVAEAGFLKMTEERREEFFAGFALSLAVVLPRTRTHASTNGPMSQGQTVP